MKLLTKLRYGLARLLVKAATGTIGNWSIVSPWTRAAILAPAFSWLVRDGYQRNAVVFACISALAFDYPEAPIRVYTDESDDAPANDAHPLRTLLRRPNTLMGERELWMYVVVYAAIGGNAYLHKVRDQRGRAVELWPYHAEQMWPRPGGEQWVTGYVFRDAEGIEHDIPREDVIHFKWPAPDPRQPWIAQPPLMAAAGDVDADNEMARYLRTLLINDAIPRTVISQSPERMMSDEEIVRAKAEFASQYRGDGLGGVLVLEAGASVHRLSMNLEELNFEALHRVPEKRIAAVLRVPLSVAGIGDDPTYANSEEAYKRFVRSTLAPLWALWGDEVQNSLGDEFGVVVRHDTSRVSALQEDRDALWGRVNSAFQAGSLTLNQANRLRGLPTIVGGDVYLWGAMVIPVPEASVGALATAETGIALTPPPAALPGPVVEAESVTEERSRPTPERKAGEATARRHARALQRVRRGVERRMERALESYFDDLAATIVRRARDGGKADDLPSADQLLLRIDGESLIDLLERYYLEIIAASWETWNTALAVEVSFEASDPIVVEVLKTAATQVAGITETTREAIQRLLSAGAEQGWSIAQLIDGVDGAPGLRAVVQETYRGRAQTIARTEVARAQAEAAQARYADAGVEKVLILDNGQDDPDAACAKLNGTVQTLAWYRKNPIAHPNCTRAASPYFSDD